MSYQNRIDEIGNGIINDILNSLVPFIENLRSSGIHITETIKEALRRFNLSEQIKLMYNIAGAKRGITNPIEPTNEYIKVITGKIAERVSQYYSISNLKDIFSISLHTTTLPANSNHSNINNEQIPINPAHPFDLKPIGRTRKKDYDMKELSDGRYEVRVGEGNYKFDGKCQAVPVDVDEHGDTIYQDQTLYAEEVEGEEHTHILGCTPDPSLPTYTKRKRPNF